MSHVYLVIFQYHEPISREQFADGVIEDFESTTGVFIEANSAEAALTWCKSVAQELLCRCNRNSFLNWESFGYSCWIEPQPEKSPWSHCLSFFPHVRAGEFPNVDAMTSAAYLRWQNNLGTPVA